MSKKVIFALIVGFGAGVTTGWFIAKRRIETELEEAYQWDREDMQANYEEKLADELEKHGIKAVPRTGRAKLNSEDLAEGEELNHIPSVVSKSSLDNQDYKKVVTQYHKIKPPLESLARSTTTSEDEDEDSDEDADIAETELDEEDIADGEALSRVDNEDPYEIDYDAFVSSNTHYDKIDLYYYRLDDTVCGDDDEKIDEPEDLIGWDVFKTLERKANAFVRNEKLHSDFEIHTLQSSYQETIAGLIETDREREGRRIARKKALMDADDEN